MLSRPLTYGEKVLYSHLCDMADLGVDLVRGQSHMNFSRQGGDAGCDGPDGAAPVPQRRKG